MAMVGQNKVNMGRSPSVLSSSSLAIALLLCSVSVLFTVPSVDAQQVVPCKIDGSSHDCGCSKLEGQRFVVNCGFLRKYDIKGGLPDYKNPSPRINDVVNPLLTNFFPGDLQAQVDELYLYNNSLRFRGASSLNLLQNVKVLNFRFNDMNSIPETGFTRQTKLEELILEDNQITRLEKGTFQTTTSLQLLRLGGNKISMVFPETFQNTKKLRLLRLENNQITALEPGTFDFQDECISDGHCLEELHLQRNLITELKGNIFRPLVGIKYLWLQVNPPLRLIAPEVFGSIPCPSGNGSQCVVPPASSLLRLGMLGSASSCDKQFDGVPISCRCALGYVDGSDDEAASSCQPVDCGSKIQGLPSLADATCDGVYGDTCEASCITGYVGSNRTTMNPAIYTCEADGKWKGEIECEAVKCSDKVPLNILDKNSHITCEGDSLLYKGPACIATCDEGFVLDQNFSPEYRCNSEKEWVGNIQCKPVTCPSTIPQLKAGRFAYLTPTGGPTSKCDDTEYESKCLVRCKDGFRENEDSVKEFVCNANGEWEGQLDCKGKRCGRSAITAPFTVSRCLGDVSYDGDMCGVSCLSGYTPNGEFDEDTRAYCKSYAEKCPQNFADEFGDSGEGQCVFFAQQITSKSPFGQSDSATDTIACRSAKLQANNCEGGRLNLNKQCTESVCRVGSVECLECGKDGNWVDSKLTCSPIVCPATPEALKTSACLRNKTKADCQSDFELLVEPGMGPHCNGSNTFEKVCDVSCKFGYVPKNSPFECRASQSGAGLWQGQLPCMPITCPVKKIDEFLLGDGIDPQASYLSNRNPVACDVSFNKSQPVRPQEDIDACDFQAQYHNETPTELIMACGYLEDSVYLNETYTLTCSDPSWKVLSSSNGPRKGEEPYPFQTAERFCRLRCSPDISEIVESCNQANIGEGDTCTVKCRKGPQHSVTFLCDPDQGGEWTNQTENLCLEFHDSTSTTTTTTKQVAASASNELSTGGRVAVIVFPIIIVIICIVLLLYYFGLLRKCGLEATKSKAQIYGDVQAKYGEIYASGRTRGAAGGRRASKGAELSLAPGVSRIKGRAAAKK